MLNQALPDFDRLDTQVLGIGVDSPASLSRWADNMGGIKFPLCADFWPHGSVSTTYATLRPGDGYSDRVVLWIDKSGRVRYRRTWPLDEARYPEMILPAIRDLLSTD